MDSEKLDMIAFGAHPDDVEIGAGGLIAKQTAQGYKVGIVDLTRGELSTRGTVEIREQEGYKAAGILGAVWRKTLGIPDGEVSVCRENIDLVVPLLRKYKPTVVLAPYWEDRHPDHVKAAHLIEEAVFKAGLVKYMPEIPPFRPQVILHYYLNRPGTVSFIVDISEYFATKWEALLAHDSQFGQRGLLGAKDPLSFVESRNRQYGAQIGVEYGEAFTTKVPVPLNDPIAAWRETK
ncbi:LmbE family protein [Thermincola ferriacetica]|uniref:LmbE family protein n=1 Tax=Thermincola ferriacetica TaxID=281456 RepID=A0A0L6VZP1_9FIRM|nr:bacillithiol biosynthesis deacetylase BshB1 [Thermincola ferriacetica]KNZ68613.1 LmbE family protein [Thermincola ferriacetica]